MRDWHGSLRTAKDNEVVVAHSQVSWEQRAASFFDPGDSGASDSRKPIKEKETMRLPNIDYLLALDNSLMCSIGSSVDKFIVERGPDCLSKGSRRYWVQGGPVTSTTGEQLPSFRPCVERRADGHRAFEMPRAVVEGVEHRPALHLFADQRAVGWPALHYMYARLRVRGAIEHDRWHVTWNAVRAAMGASCMWALVLELTVVLKCKRGPFQGAAFLGSVQGVAEEYFSTTDHNCLVCQYFYKEIVEEQGPLPAEFGTPDQQEVVFKASSSAKILKNVGECVKLARWFSWMSAVKDHLLPGWSSLLLVLVVMGIRRGWWASIDDLSRACGRHVCEQSCR